MGKAVKGVTNWIQGNKKEKAAKQKEEEAKGLYEKQRNAYKNVDTGNPFEGMINQYASLTNQYAGLENTMEDLTINQRQAEFEQQEFAASQANILSGLREASGGSGIAALAQSLARQGQIASQKAAASIGMQESANQRMAAAQAGKLQTQEAKGGSDIQLQKAKGQADVDKLVAEGEQRSQALNLQKETTLLNLDKQEYDLARGVTADANKQKQSGIADTFGGIVDTIATVAMSDRKLKKNIKLIGKSPSGINIYLFEYIDKIFGEGVYQGVMSDELSNDAVISGKYDMVDYSKIDVEFKKIK